MNRLTPAEYVIRLFEGVRPLARLLTKETGKTVDPSVVSKWQHPGRDGTVPQKRHIQLFKVAKKEGVKLTAENLVHGNRTSSKKSS